MSLMPFGMTMADARDQEAEDHDEAAWRRDRAGASRDRDALERDLRAEDDMRAALQYTRLVGQMLDVGSQRGDQVSIADHSAMLRNLLAKFKETLQAADADRQAACHDRQAAAGDRLLAAGDRDIIAAHRGQAAIEREQQVGYRGTAGRRRSAALLASAQAACARAETLCQHTRGPNAGPPSRREMLRQSLVAQLEARMGTVPVVEQAKGIVMAQRQCSEAEAFDLLRQASQRLNEPVRDLAARIVTNDAARCRPGTAD